MKMLLNTIALAALFALPLTGMTGEALKQSINKMHKVVFEVAIDDSEKWEGALRNGENVQKSLGAKTSSGGARQRHRNPPRENSGNESGMKTTVEEPLASGVVFAVCENTMKRMQIAKVQLVPLATTVDSGVSEVISKQEVSYTYIQSGG